MQLHKLYLSPEYEVTIDSIRSAQRFTVPVLQNLNTLTPYDPGTWAA